MPVFYNQPLSFRFGTSLRSIIDDETWTTFEIAVAWARRSGTKHLLPSLVPFLRRGGVFRASIGVDIENTSQEGLADLLSLRDYGMVELFVYHNEAQGVFHPKVYLFSNQQVAKLIVGSNNVTEAGLFINVEAGLEIDATVNDAAISDARAALAAWRDPALNLALPLDDNLLSDLIRLGYVKSESSLRAQRQNQRRNLANDQAREALFGRVHLTAPRIPDTPNELHQEILGAAEEVPQIAPVQEDATEEIQANEQGALLDQVSQAVGTVLLMRVRKAHVEDRPTQTQLPQELFRSPFFQGVTEIISAHDAQPHKVSEARARGIVNTLKLEIPEMRTFDDPVLRLERTSEGVVYQAYDATSVLGQPIMAALQRGLTMEPPATRATIANLERATLWRFI